MSTPYRLRTVRFRFTVALAFLIIGLLILLVRDDIYQFFPIERQAVLGIGLITMLQGVAILLLIYLKGDLPLAISRTQEGNPQNYSDSEKSTSQIEGEITRLAQKVEDISQRSKDEPLRGGSVAESRSRPRRASTLFSQHNPFQLRKRLNALHFHTQIPP